MRTEYHCHILPGIDDGSDSAETSLAMISLMQEQGIARIIATPHFYAHREKSVAHYLEKRQAAFSQIQQQSPVSEIRLGAEVAIEQGLSELAGIEQLRIAGTDLILLELPYRPYASWMSEEIYNIAAEYHLRVILAHVHRYLEYYSKSEMQKILSANVIFQVNNEAFGSWKERRFVKKLIAEEMPVVFGSDAHNLGNRRPNWDLLQRKCKPDIISASDQVLDRHLQK